MKKTILYVVIVLFAIFFGFLYFGSLFTDKFVQEKIEAVQSAERLIHDTTRVSLTGKPFSLRRYFAGSIKDSLTGSNFAKVVLEGEFKTNEKSDWMPINSEQYFNMLVPEFVKDSKIKTSPFTWIRSVESFDKGSGNLLIKFLSSLTISDVQSDEIDQSYLVNYLVESVMFPPALFPSEYLSWKKINNEIVEATLKYRGITVSAKFHINRENEVFKVTTTDNFKTGRTGYQQAPFIVLYSDYKWFGNYKIPTKQELQWILRDSVLTYSRFSVTNIVYSDRLTE